VLSKRKLFLVIINLTGGLSLQASDKKSSFWSDFRTFMVDHPKQTAFVAGALTTGVILALNEKNLRASEGLDAVKSCSRPGLLNMPIQHGYSPFFWGKAVGSVTAVCLGRARLDRKADLVLNRSKKISDQSDLIKKTSANHLSSITNVNQQADANNSVAAGQVQASGQIVGQAKKLNSSLADVQAGIGTVSDQICSLDQEINLANCKTGKLNEGITDLQQGLGKFKKQSQVSGFVQNVSLRAVFINLANATNQQNQLSSDLAAQSKSIDELAITRAQQQAGLENGISGLSATSHCIAKTRESVDKMQQMMGQLRKNECAGGSGSDE
jgi:hypothetical protein